MKWMLAATALWFLAGCANPNPNRIQVNQDYRQWQDSQAPAGWY